MTTPLILRRGRVILADRVIEHAAVRLVDGRIDAVGPEAEIASGGDEEIDLDGQFIAPGFVDGHCHGDGTTRFFDDPETVSANLAARGTTTVLATLGYPDMQAGQLATQLRTFLANAGEHTRAILGGVHMEGPYVNRLYGSQTSKGVIKNPDPDEYVALIAEFPDLIKWWTCAPELPGAVDFIRAAVRGGGVVGAGHTEASVEQLRAAIDGGLRAITHWSNATGNAHAAAFKGTRCPGIDEAALVFDEVSAEIIPDEQGLHVHPLMARLLFKAKGPERILIITDAGYSRPDDPPASPEACDVSIDAEGNLAGSRLTMAGASRNFRKATGCTWPELFRMAALNAARLLQRDHEIGSIAPGKWANLIVCDDHLRISRTFVRGRQINGE